MSTFNKRKRTTSDNKAGFTGFTRTDAKQELASIIFNSTLSKDSFYESNSERMVNIERLFVEVDESIFLLKLMVFTRTEMNLRSATHFLAVLALENIKGIEETRRALSKVLIRPDDATEIVALWNSRNKENIPNALRRAIRDALETRWDGYQLRKYYGTNNAVKVPDLIKLTHPRNNRPIFKQALEGTLPTIDTAQTVNSGLTGADRKAKYEGMLNEGSLGVMAALKNLVNMIEVGTDLSCFGNLMGDGRRIERSRVLPFRFAQAYAEVSKLRFMDMFAKKKVLEAIQYGFMLSATNLELADDGDRVALLLDESGSMGGYQNDMDDKFFIGKVMMSAVMVQRRLDDTIGFLWADNTREVALNREPLEFVMNTNTRGGGTNLGQSMDKLIKSKTAVDTIYVFTDMQQNQIGGSYWSRDSRSFNSMVQTYRTEVNRDVKVVFWNLAGYGGSAPMQLNQYGVLEVAGFSTKMLQLIKPALNGVDSMVLMIEKVQL